MCPNSFLSLKMYPLELYLVTMFARELSHFSLSIFLLCIGSLIFNIIALLLHGDRVCIHALLPLEFYSQCLWSLQLENLSCICLFYYLDLQNCLWEAIYMKNFNVLTSNRLKFLLFMCYYFSIPVDENLL